MIAIGNIFQGDKILRKGLGLRSIRNSEQVIEQNTDYVQQAHLHFQQSINFEIFSRSLKCILVGVAIHIGVWSCMLVGVVMY